MLGATLGIVFGRSAAPVAFTFVVLAACGFSIDKLAREWLPPNAAALVACAYILNPYALFVAYERTAYAELAAGIWLPLIILYAVRNPEKRCHPERSAKRQSKDLRFPPASTNAGAPYDAGAPGPAGALSPRLTWVPHNSSTIPLAIAIAAIWLTNAPAAVMACYALAAITIWKSIAQRSWHPILNSAISLILGLGLAAFYIVPAAYERRWVDIARAIGPGMRIEDSFLFGRTGESFHDHVLRTASWILASMVAAIAICLVAGRRRKTAPSLLLPISGAAILLFALQLPWSEPIWRVAPELKFLQFPWRLTLPLSIVFALSVGAAAILRSPQPTQPNFRWRAAAISATAIAAVSMASWLFWQPCDEEDAVSAQVAVFQSGAGFEGTDEYTPVGADNSLIQQGLPPIRVLDAADAETAPEPASDDQANPVYAPSSQAQIAAPVKIEQWRPERKTFILDAAAPGFAVLRLLDYPAWQVTVNEEPVADRPHRDDGLVAIPIPAGPSRIEVAYKTTADVWCGRGISLASLLTLLGLGLASQKRRAVS